MSKRRIILLFLLLATTLAPAMAQSWDEITSETDLYYSAEGTGETIEEADKIAIDALISQIWIAVDSQVGMDESETTKDNKSTYNANYQMSVKTYSAATLTNTQRIVIDPMAYPMRVGRYIKRTEVERIFEGRKRTIKEYARLGDLGLKKLKIDDALRNYYWAYLLTNSLQHPSEATYIDEASGDSVQLITWLPARIDQILDNIEIDVASNDGSTVMLEFTYDDKPVSTLDFTYFDGRNWTNISGVKGGEGEMEFAQGSVPKNIPINIEYAYRSQVNNHELKAVVETMKLPRIAGSNSVIKIDKEAEAKSVSTPKSNRVTSTDSAGKIAPVENEKPYLELLGEVVKAINTKQYSSVEHLFTENGYDMYNKLISIGRAKMIDSEKCNLYQFRDRVVARSLKMSLRFKYGSCTNFIEDIVFTFNEEKKIESVAFGLDEIAKNDILNKNIWSETARLTIVEFLENYKTAYSLKRLDYLQTIFDDNAVIIVGNVVKRLERDKADMAASYTTNTYVTRTRLSKKEYLNKLATCFKSQEFINIRFANSDVRKSAYGDEYGIQIKQDYYSTNYGDEGYLYLQVDLNDPDKPIIKVRTWQVEPDKEIGLYDMSLF